MHVAVMGAGSLGSLVGGLLATSHEVTLVGRQPHMRAVAADGLTITGRLERTVHPAATSSWSAVSTPDAALLTVKTYDTRTAAEAMARAPPPVVLTLQNGLETCAILRHVLPATTTVLAGTVTYGALLDAPGRVRCTGEGEVTIGAPDGGRDPSAEGLAEAFVTAGMRAAAAADMPQRRWRKLAINAAINPVTALARVRNGAVREPPLRPLAVALAGEVGAVAEARGIAVDREEVPTAMLEVAARTRDNESSMARDVRRGRRTEIDAITGAVLERAEGTPVPMNDALYRLIKGYEAGRNTRE